MSRQFYRTHVPQTFLFQANDHVIAPLLSTIDGMIYCVRFSITHDGSSSSMLPGTPVDSVQSGRKWRTVVLASGDAVPPRCVNHGGCLKRLACARSTHATVLTPH
jgi:hypothetical protein